MQRPVWASFPPVHYASTQALHAALESTADRLPEHIAIRFGDAQPAHGLPALMGAGLVLFVMTLTVNTVASLIVRRSRSGKGVEI